MWKLDTSRHRTLHVNIGYSMRRLDTGSMLDTYAEFGNCMWASNNSMHIGYSMCTLNSSSRLHIEHLMDTIINYANGVSNMHSTCCSKCSHKVANINMTCVISPSKVQYADHKEYSMFTWSIQYPYEVPKMLLKSNNCVPELNFFRPNSTFTSPKSTLTYPNLTIGWLNSTII